jgi:hypothetical protein
VEQNAYAHWKTILIGIWDKIKFEISCVI